MSTLFKDIICFFWVDKGILILNWSLKFSLFEKSVNCGQIEVLFNKQTLLLSPFCLTIDMSSSSSDEIEDSVSLFANYDF